MKIGFNWLPWLRQTQMFVVSDPNSTFVLPGNHHHDYQHSHLDLSALTPKLGKNARRSDVELI